MLSSLAKEMRGGGACRVPQRSKAFYTVSHRHPCNEAQELWDRRADSEVHAELVSGRAQRAVIGGTECRGCNQWCSPGVGAGPGLVQQLHL